MTVIIFVLVLIVLVVVHEFGHFIAAKLLGIKVQEFGVGFPPRLASIKKGETRYSLNALPLGGFVKIFGEEGEGDDNERSYASRSPWQKTLVLLAGVAFNLLFAFFIFWVAFTIGFPTSVDDAQDSLPVRESHVQVIDLASKSPAKEGDLRRGDIILNVQGPSVGDRVTVGDVATLRKFADEHRGQTIDITIQRGDEVLKKHLLARQAPPEGQGPLGISLARIGLVSYPWWEAAWQAFLATVRNAFYVFVGLFLLIKALFGQGAAIGEVSGPVGIAVMTRDFYLLGIHYFLSFLAIISINLAVINVLPIPALDGGRLFFLLIEKLKGSPIAPETENKVNAIGFAFLITLLLIVTIKDILQL